MHPDDPRRFALIMPLAFPVIGWIVSAWYMHWLHADAMYIIRLVMATPRSLPLAVGAIAGLIVGVLSLVVLFQLTKPAFTGAPYARFIRGVHLVTAKQLAAKTKESGRQVTVAGIPIPAKTQSLHFLIAGSTGTGKSVLLREMSFSAKKAGHRSAIFDSNGELYSRFGMPRDKVLNPFDTRTEGWSIFNEIFDPDIDIPKLASCLIPGAATPRDEMWNELSRAMTVSLMSKLYACGDLSVASIVHWGTKAPLDQLANMLAGTEAESLLSSAEDSIKSIRLGIGKYLPPHCRMPNGAFSIRRWINEGPDGGDLYIIRDKASKQATKALMSTWANLICAYTLTRTPSQVAPLWAQFEELSDMEKLSGLIEAQTEGRKSGLHIIGNIQSISQIESIYGQKDAETLLSCFGSAVILGGGAADKRMNELMSDAIGKQEVERIKKSRSRTGTSTTVERHTEALVLSTEVASMPELQCYVRLARMPYAAKATLIPTNFKERNRPFIQRPAAVAELFALNAELADFHAPTIASR